ncbi:MAG: type II secretion system protein [Burkholderiales bacterium]|nr:type II secretion system protein [Burkholderiales bacterium]
MNIAVRGFTLLEVTIALVVLGLITSVASTNYLGLWRKVGGKTVVDANLVSLSGSVITFAKSHHRLPCPDTKGNGYENLDNAGVCVAGTQVGRLPYISLGLSLPSDDDRAYYGVYRNATTDPAADLTVSVTQNNLTAAATAAVSPSFVYVTGDGTTTNGVESCGGYVASNPAYVILAAGEDRDGVGGSLDGINIGLASGGRCFSAASRGIDGSFDDRSLALSFYGLLAELNK